jgi:hypothetical protein
MQDDGRVERRRLSSVLTFLPLFIDPIVLWPDCSQEEKSADNVFKNERLRE